MFSHRPLIGVVLAVLIGTAVAACSDGGSPASKPTATSSTTTQATVAAPQPPPSPAPKSDEDQVREVIQGMQDAYNTSNWEKYRTLLCPRMREQFVGPVLVSLQRQREQTGLLDTLIGTVTINGDEASAVVTQHQERGTPPDTGSFRLVRDTDGWKACVNA
jgi:hypothetical protein